MKVALSALLVVAVGGSAAYAQVQRSNSDFSTMQESGPPVAGGNGTTVGPNWKNQATSPMPGSDISELPRYPISDAPIMVKPVAPPPKKPPPRAPQ
ncbi:MAG: hypothetical protein JWQ58_3619 [Reyranella sp.]|nr:hypothetical protein [Reyranella sp.]